MKTIQKCKLEGVEIPANAYAVIKELAEQFGVPIEEFISESLLSILESDLETPEMFDCSQELLDSFCKKHDFDPGAWRREEESA